MASCGTFELDYQRITISSEVNDFPDWSIYITIYIGFSLMFIAFIYFEWRELLKCFKRCQERGCSRSQPSQIHYIENEDRKNQDRRDSYFDEGANRSFPGSHNGSDSGDEDLVGVSGKAAKNPDNLYNNY